MNQMPLRGTPLPAGWKYGDPAPELPRMDVVLENHLAPGDVTVMTAAVACLHDQHPGRVRTWVDTTAPALWDHNPHVEAGPPPAGTKRITLEYPAINRSNQEPIHFMKAYCESLTRVTGLRVRLTRTRPALYLSDAEKTWTPQPNEGGELPARYWVLNAGVKSDFTTKAWGRENYQALVRALRGVVRFVQVGELHHAHPPVDGAIDLRGKTDVRQLVRLAHHADGGVGPTTFLQHLCAAWQKPYVCLLGGREPVSWVQYPQQTTLHTIGALPCCGEEACWRSRTVALNDGEPSDRSLCALPVVGADPIPSCMALISVDSVRESVLRYIHGMSVL